MDASGSPVARSTRSPLKKTGTVNLPDIPDVTWQIREPEEREPQEPDYSALEEVFLNKDHVGIKQGSESIRIVRTSFRYPLVRIVESATDCKAMVADHMIVKIAKGIEERVFREFNEEKQGTTIRGEPLAPRTYLVAFRIDSADSLPKMIETYRRESKPVESVQADFIGKLDRSDRLILLSEWIRQNNE